MQIRITPEKKQALAISTMILFLLITIDSTLAIIPEEITTDTNNDITPTAIEDSSNIIYVVYASNRNGNYNIFYQTSKDEGTTWSTPKKITNSNELHPSIIQDSGGEYTIIYTSDSTGNSEIWSVKSTDGQTWSTPHKITNSSENKMKPTIIQDSTGKYFIIWSISTFEEGKGQVDKIQYVTSTDGTTWSDTNFFSIDTITITDAKLSEYFGTYYLVYQNSGKIYYSSSNDAETWSTPTAISTGTDNTEPEYFIDYSGKHHIIWTSIADGNDNIHHRSSTDGTTWSPESPITIHTATDVSGHILQDKNRNYWIFFRSDRTGNRNIWFMKDSSFPFETEAITESCGDNICSIDESCETCPTDCACGPTTPISPCKDIICSDKCKGTTKYANGYCVGNGECAYPTIIENSTECGHIEKNPKQSKEAQNEENKTSKEISETDILNKSPNETKENQDIHDKSTDQTVISDEEKKPEEHQHEKKDNANEEQDNKDHTLLTIFAIILIITILIISIIFYIYKKKQSESKDNNEENYTGYPHE
ncbi:MAG: hypothetical protein DRN71_00480 [Candidatus Nanohalarchaeota archaeon]|nr:MAG: hypothetical protein DRN71_00480 [Candidatus Nanohaloarchaeota archaeon]